MKRSGHYGIALLACDFIFLLLPVNVSLIIILPLIATANLPNTVELSFFKRRGSPHTVLFAICSGLVVYAVLTVIHFLFDALLRELLGMTLWFNPAGPIRLFSVGVVIGVIMHILGDIIVSEDAKKSVKPFWPVLRYGVAVGVFDEDNPFISGGLLIFSVIIGVLVLMIRLSIHVTPLS